MPARLALVFLPTLLFLGISLSAQSAAPGLRPASTAPGEESRGSRSTTPALAGELVRGRYLVEHVAMCIECHSTRDDAGQIIPGREFMGGNIPFRPPWSNDWAAVAPRNAGLLGYSDDQAMRLLTSGAIGREGVRLRPPMPRFQMTREDAAAVIAYLRTR
jgi:mono/diheme cytochrome c family protein